MNLPLRIRHTFNRAGVFDLRRRVLMKNFLLGNKYKLEPPDEEPIVNEVENEPNCDEACNSTAEELGQTNSIESVVPEVSVQDVGEPCVPNSNAFIIETNALSTPKTFEEIECATKSNECIQPTDDESKTKINRKMKHFSLKRKLEKQSCSNESSRSVEESIGSMSSAYVSFDEQNKEDQRSGNDMTNEIILGKESQQKVKKSRFCFKLKRRLPGKNGSTAKKSKVLAKNKSSVCNKSDLKKYEDSFSYKINLRKKQTTIEKPKCSEGKASKSIFRLFQSKTLVESSERKNGTMKRKRDLDHQVVERMSSRNRSVSVQTEVTIPSRIHQSTYSSYNRMNKRPRFDEDGDKNKYWLRSTSISEVRVLKPLNSETKTEGHRSPQADFFPSKMNCKFDDNKVVRSKSIQENKSVRIPATICRRVKSVRLPVSNVEAFNERHSCIKERNFDYCNRLRRRSSEENLHYHFASPRTVKHLQVPASPYNAVGTSDDYGFSVNFK